MLLKESSQTAAFEALCHISPKHTEGSLSALKPAEAPAAWLSKDVTGVAHVRGVV